MTGVLEGRMRDLAVTDTRIEGHDNLRAEKNGQTHRADGPTICNSSSTTTKNPIFNAPNPSVMPQMKLLLEVNQPLNKLNLLSPIFKQTCTLTLHLCPICILPCQLIKRLQIRITTRPKQHRPTTNFMQISLGHVMEQCLVTLVEGFLGLWSSLMIAEEFCQGCF